MSTLLRCKSPQEWVCDICGQCGGCVQCEPRTMFHRGDWAICDGCRRGYDQ